MHRKHKKRKDRLKMGFRRVPDIPSVIIQSRMERQKSLEPRSAGMYPLYPGIHIFSMIILILIYIYIYYIRIRLHVILVLFPRLAPSTPDTKAVEWLGNCGYDLLLMGWSNPVPLVKSVPGGTTFPGIQG